MGLSYSIPTLREVEKEEILGFSCNARIRHYVSRKSHVNAEGLWLNPYINLNLGTDSVYSNFDFVTLLASSGVSSSKSTTPIKAQASNLSK